MFQLLFLQTFGLKCLLNKSIISIFTEIFLPKTSFNKHLHVCFSNNVIEFSNQSKVSSQHIQRKVIFIFYILYSSVVE